MDNMEDLNYGQLMVKEYFFKYQQKIKLKEEFMHLLQFVNLILIIQKMNLIVFYVVIIMVKFLL